MNKKINIINVVKNEKFSIDYENNYNKTLKSILQDFNIKNADVTKEFNISGKYSFNTNSIPYIVRNDKILWNLKFSEFNLEDLVRTMQIKNIDDIIIEYGIPQAGGVGWPEINQFWNVMKEVLSNIVLMFDLGVIASMAYKYLEQKFKTKNINPMDILDFVCSKDYWYSKEISDFMEIEEEHAISILTAIGYEWDKSNHYYQRTHKTEEIISNLKKRIFELSN